MSASGGQAVGLTSPVPAGATYVASYRTSTARNMAHRGDFTPARGRGVLQASSSQTANDWADVTFASA